MIKESGICIYLKKMYEYKTYRNFVCEFYIVWLKCNIK